MSLSLKSQTLPYQCSLPAADAEAFNAWISTFYPFQQAWLLDPSEYAICNKSRQIGLSHTSAALGVIWAAYHGETTTIISIGDRESSEVLDKAKRHASVLERLGSPMAKAVRNNASEIKFRSGGKLLALPGSGGRGFAGNIILDEFAYHQAQQDEKVYDAAMAVTTLGKFRARMISTPNGVSNKFADIWRASADSSFGWNRHEVPVEMAVAQGYPIDLKKCWTLAAGNEILFSQLFQCQFVDANSRFLFKQIRRDESRYTELPRIFEQICIGLDFASSAKTSADYSCAVVLGRIGDTYYVLDVIRMHVDPRTFRDRIPALLAQYPNATCSADVAPTEIGGVEFVREAGIPVTLRTATADKFTRAMYVAAEWNQARVLLPVSAPWLDPFIAEVTGFTGVPGKDRHDDQVDAFSSSFNGMRFSRIDIEYLNSLNAALPKTQITW